MSKLLYGYSFIVAFALCITLDPTIAQEKPKTQAKSAALDQVIVTDGAQVPVDEKHAKFQRLLTGAKLIGQFTVDGKPLDKLSAEEYEITKVEKAPEGDVWVLSARIKYGNKDVTIPVPLEVKWAGSTPVLTLDNLPLPGLGTFSARVVLHRDKYAGTWQHDDKGGHMFGRIEIAKSATESK